MDYKDTGNLFLLLLCFAGISTIWQLSDMSTSLISFSKAKECSKKNLGTMHYPNAWFTQRFNKNITPLLTRNYNLSQDAFNWWKRLRFERRNLRFFKQTTQKVFEVFPGNPPVPEPGLDGCRTCAVVGNSMNLKRSHYGKLIDQHTSIFRINRGQTEGFEEDVGNRTTHRVIYPQTATNLDNSTHLVLFPFSIRDLQWLTTGVNIMSSAPDNKTKQISVNKNLVMVVNPAFMKYVHYLWLNHKKLEWPSTGFMVVILALHICDEVSVFGFGADIYGSWSHYWEELQKRRFRTGHHPGSFEYKVILELAKQGKVVFYRGW